MLPRVVIGLLLAALERPGTIGHRGGTPQRDKSPAPTASGTEVKEVQACPDLPVGGLGQLGSGSVWPVPWGDAVNGLVDRGLAAVDAAQRNSPRLLVESPRPQVC